MRIKLIFLAFCFLLMAFLPLLSANGNISDKDSEQSSSINENLPSTEEVEDINKREDGIFRILDTSSGKVVDIGEKEFCVGALAYEMQPSFEEEALKAQTVALYTFFCRKRALQQEKPDSKLKGADFQADLSKGELYLDENKLRRKWGKYYDSSIKKIRAVVDDVYGIVITDSTGKPIDACYHAISGGITENAEDIFGKKDDNLISVPSPYDTAAPDYISEVSVSEETFRSKLKEIQPGVKFPSRPDKYIGETVYTNSGSVISQKIGGAEFSGTEIRKLFSLRSAVYEVKYLDGEFVFTVRGYGHGVGMSQWGAQVMALQGASYEEILRHYYSGITLT